MNVNGGQWTFLTLNDMPTAIPAVHIDILGCLKVFVKF